MISPASGDEAQHRAIEEHLTRHVGAPTMVFHEIVSSNVHVDVHIIPADGERPATLFTTGMSDRPMTVPDGAEGLAYAELMIRLPPEWRLTSADFQDERWYWPVRWLKTLARMPHDLGTWLGYGHTIPNGDPAAPFAEGTKLCGMLLLPALSLPEEAWSVRTESGRTVHLWSLYPLHRDEMDLKLRKGTDELLDAFDRARVSDVVDPDRRSAVARKKWLGLF